MAVESMTGFSRQEMATADGARIVCEIRSVNGKSLDVRMRLPNGLERLEIPVRQLAQQKLTRGNLQVSISVDQAGSGTPLAINHALVNDILAMAETLRERHGLELPSVGELLSIRGVMETPDTEGGEDHDADILALASRAFDDLKRFRMNEGAALAAVLEGHLASIGQLVAQAAADPSKCAEAIRERLASQIRLLMDSSQGLDEQRLAQEAVLLATKADIREEIDRLNGHIAAVRQLLAVGGPVGRKLDFLSQEFNREVNTLCSKSNAATVTAIGLELKAVVDQFREQVQNLE